MKSYTISNQLFEYIGIALITFILCFLGIMIIRPWMYAKKNNMGVSLLKIVVMVIRNSNPMIILKGCIILMALGKTIYIDDVESIYLTFKDEIHNPNDLVNKWTETNKNI